MFEIAQAESAGVVYTHTDSSLVKGVVKYTTFMCGAKNKVLCNKMKYIDIICNELE